MQANIFLPTDCVISDILWYYIMCSVDVQFVGIVSLPSLQLLLSLLSVIFYIILDTQHTMIHDWLWIKTSPCLTKPSWSQLMLCDKIKISKNYDPIKVHPRLIATLFVHYWLGQCVIMLVMSSGDHGPSGDNKHSCDIKWSLDLCCLQTTGGDWAQCPKIFLNFLLSKVNQ